MTLTTATHTQLVHAVNLSNVTFEGSIENWSHKTGGCLIQVYLHVLVL